MQNIFHNKRNIKLISLLFIVAMLFCTLDSKELFLNSRSRVNSDKSLSLINNLGEISLAFYAKADFPFPPKRTILKNYRSRKLLPNI